MITIQNTLSRPRWSLLPKVAFLGTLLLVPTWVANALDAYEPDNLPGRATVLPVNGVSQIHTLDPVGDYDLFKVTLAEDATVYFDFTVLENDPKPILGFGLFSTNLISIDPASPLASASYILMSDEALQYGPAVPTTFLTKGSYIGVVVYLTCPTQEACSATPKYRIGATELTGVDPYEPDNSAAEARWISVNGPVQIHTLGSLSDHDWVGFYEPYGNRALTVSATLFGAATSPVIQLVTADGTTVLASAGGDPGDRTNLVYTTTPSDIGILYVSVTGGAKGVKTDGDSFALTVKSGAGVLPSALAGVVMQAGNGGMQCGPQPVIADATIEIVNLGNLSTISDASGAYAFASIPSDTYTVTASATGFLSQTKVVTVGSTTQTLDFTLTASGKSTTSPAGLPGSGFLGDLLVLSAALAASRIVRRKGAAPA